MLHPVMFYYVNRHKLAAHFCHFQLRFIGLCFNQAGAFMVCIVRGIAIAIGAFLQISHIILHAAHQIVFALVWFGNDAIPRQLLHAPFGQV